MVGFTWPLVVDTSSPTTHPDTEENKEMIE
jgi:hypothetical protein